MYKGKLNFHYSNITASKIKFGITNDHEISITSISKKGYMICTENQTAT